MIHTNDSIIKYSDCLNLAEEFGNISQAYKVHHPDTFYRYREAVEGGGVRVLLEKSRRVPNHKNRVDAGVEEAVAAYAVEEPANRLCVVRSTAHWKSCSRIWTNGWSVQ